MARRTLLFLLAVGLAAAACASEDAASESSSSDPTPTATAEAAATPTVESDLVETGETIDVDGTELVEAPLGAYLVGRQFAGMPYGEVPGLPANVPGRAIPVFDEPGGEPRTMVETNAIDAVTFAQPLLNWGELGDRASPVVLRLVAGTAADEFVLVQAPTRPHDRVMWVRADDFHFAFTTTRIEIDLADEGELRVHDGDRVLMRSPIVQGRESRPTPTHLTYLQGGFPGSVFGPAWGHAVLDIASFSEVLGTFGGRGQAPHNYIHGTNQPGLVGQRISSTKVRLPDDRLAELIELVHPGVPVLIYDSELGRLRQSVLDAQWSPVATVDFDVGEVSSTSNQIRPQLWTACEEPQRLCRTITLAESAEEQDFRFRYAVAKPGDDQIPVHDLIGGEARTLVDTNPIDGVDLLYPLHPTTPFGQPLVLRVVDTALNDSWLRVQVPVRPNGSTVWVEAKFFEVDVTSIWIEIDVGSGAGCAPTDCAGWLRVHDGPEAFFTVPIVSGRGSRPTPLATGWVSQLVEGERLTPAYGTWVIGIGIHSEVLGTFGGGGQPRMAIHGTNQPDLIGQRLSSGGIRLENNAIEYVAEVDGLLGAPVFIDADSAPRRLLGVPAFDGGFPAQTTTFTPDALPIVPAFL